MTFGTEHLHIRLLSICEFREYQCSERYILHKDINEILSLFKIFILIYETKLGTIDVSGNLMSVILGEIVSMKTSCYVGFKRLLYLLITCIFHLISLSRSSSAVRYRRV
jgi:uncharacterized membrane protein